MRAPIWPAARLIQSFRTSHGYLPSFGQALTPDNPVLREAIGRFRANTCAVVTSAVDFNLYERAMREFVVVGENGRLTCVG